MDGCLQELDADLISIWLDDGEGGLFERQRMLSDRQPTGSVDIGEIEPQAVMDRLNTGELLLVHDDDGNSFVW